MGLFYKSFIPNPASASNVRGSSGTYTIASKYLPIVWPTFSTLADIKRIAVTLNADSDGKAIFDRAMFANQSLIKINVIVGNDVKTIGYDNFQDCTALGSIDFSKAKALREIGGGYAFELCSSLVEVNLHDCIALSNIGERELSRIVEN